MYMGPFVQFISFLDDQTALKSIPRPFRPGIGLQKYTFLDQYAMPATRPPLALLSKGVSSLYIYFFYLLVLKSGSCFSFLILAFL